MFQYLKFQRDIYGGTVNIFDKLTGFIEEIVEFVGKYGCLETCCMLIQILAQKNDLYYYSTTINKSLETKYNLHYDSNGNDPSATGYGENLVNNNSHNYTGNSLLQGAGNGPDRSDDRDLILMGLDTSIVSLIHNLVLRLGHFRKINVGLEKVELRDNPHELHEDPHCN